jgi:hypothetical protein
VDLPEVGQAGFPEARLQNLTGLALEAKNSKTFQTFCDSWNADRKTSLCKPSAR